MCKKKNRNVCQRWMNSVLVSYIISIILGYDIFNHTFSCRVSFYWNLISICCEYIYFLFVENSDESDFVVSCRAPSCLVTCSLILLLVASLPPQGAALPSQST